MAKSRHFRTFPSIDDLPLFKAANRNIENETYALWQEGNKGQDVSRVKDDIAKQIVMGLDKNKNTLLIEQDVVFSEDSPILIETPYEADGENTGTIGVLRIEHYEFYNVAVVEIAHSLPGVDYIHKGRKFNPSSGRYDGPEVEVPKVSKGKTHKKRYRIQYTSGKINEGNFGVFCFGGEKKDGNRVNLKEACIIPALKEIESLALQEIGLQ